jgi:hypothetical protein
LLHTLAFAGANAKIESKLPLPTDAVWPCKRRIPTVVFARNRILAVPAVHRFDGRESGSSKKPGCGAERSEHVRVIVDET